MKARRSLDRRTAGAFRSRCHESAGYSSAEPIPYAPNRAPPAATVPCRAARQQDWSNPHSELSRPAPTRPARQVFLPAAHPCPRHGAGTGQRSRCAAGAGWPRRSQGCVRDVAAESLLSPKRYAAESGDPPSTGPPPPLSGPPRTLQRCRTRSYRIRARDP
jgi:hypothetical protein